MDKRWIGQAIYRNARGDQEDRQRKTNCITFCLGASGRLAVVGSGGGGGGMAVSCNRDLSSKTTRLQTQSLVER